MGKLHPGISPAPPNFRKGGGQNLRNLASFPTSLKVEPPAFENAALYTNSETNIQRSYDCPMFTPSLEKLDSRTPENRSVKVPPAKKNCTAKRAKSSISRGLFDFARILYRL